MAESLSGRSPDLKGLVTSIIAGEVGSSTTRAKALLDQGVSIQEILEEGVLRAWSEFAEWYDRDPKGSLNKWFDCYKATDQVLKLLWSYVPEPINPPFSVLVATVLGEGHVLMRDVISLLLASKGIKVYRPRRGITPENLTELLTDGSLKYIVLSCSQEDTREALVNLINHAKRARPDLTIITGGRMAGGMGEDLTFQDLIALLEYISGSPFR